LEYLTNDPDGYKIAFIILFVGFGYYFSAGNSQTQRRLNYFQPMLRLKLFLPVLLVVIAAEVSAQDTASMPGKDTRHQPVLVLNEKAPNSADLLELLKTPGLKVFVMAADAAAVSHATHALQSATDWQIVGDKSLAQVIIRFSFTEIGMGDKKGKAQLLDPKTGIVIHETKAVSTTFSWDFNTKRGVIDRIVNKEIRKLVKD